MTAPQISAPFGLPAHTLIGLTTFLPAFDPTEFGSAVLTGQRFH